MRRQIGALSLSVTAWLIAGAVMAIMALLLRVQTDRLRQVTAEYTAFRAEVGAIGAAAEKRKQEQEAADRKRKERSDVENRRTIANLHTHIVSLRESRPSGGLVPNAPADASLCAFMPVNPAALGAVVTAQQQNPKVLDDFTGRSFICWFANAPMAKPLIGAELKSLQSFTDFDTGISALFDKAIRDNKLPKQSAEDNSSEQNAPTSKNSSGSATPIYAPSTLQVSDIKEGKQWQKSDTEGKVLATLARRNAFLVFSLHEPLIQHGLDTLAKQYPALGDKLPGKDAVALYLAPRAMTTLLQNEIRQTGSDTTLGPLLPKLEALGKKPAVVAQFDASGKASSPMSWYPLNWNTL